MTSFRQGDYDSREAGADLSTKQYYIVKTDANGKCILATAATDALRGVLVNAPKVGDTADVAIVNGSGTFKVLAGGTIAKDAFLTTDAAGKAIATTTTGNRVFGRAVAAAVSGDIVEYVKHNEKY